MSVKTICVVMMLAATIPAVAKDSRQRVEMPDQMREHMLGNMRDHLLALETITRQLANQQYDEAAAVAETRLGMTSMQSHGASHIAQFMPEEMSAIGTEMHHAASRFSIAAQNAEVDGGLSKAFAALSDVMQQCVACHSGYRVH
jgi:cytochrome c556